MANLHSHSITKVQYAAGYTLIELLLYVSIVGSLLTAISVFFASAADARIKTQSIAEVDQQGNAALDYIAQTIRNADGITAPSAGSTGTSLTVSVPNVSLNPTVFNLSGTTLQVKEGGDAAVALTNSKVAVSSLSVTNLTRSGTKGIVQVSFVVSRVNVSNKNEYSYQKTFTTSAALR